MAEAIAAFSTAVRILPDGTSELINPQPLEVQGYREEHEEHEEDALSAKYAAIAAARAIMPEKPFSINDIGKTGFESAHPPSTRFLDDKLGK